MTSIHVDPNFGDDQLRESLFRGDLAILTRLPSVSAFVEFARDQLTELFAPHDPESAHLHFSPDEAARLLGVWKPTFIHDDRSRRLVRGIVTEAGLSPADTHLDVPKPRTSFPVGHLTTGIAFAFPWHRDTWYAAPQQQINWWLPVYDVCADNAMRFDLEHFAKPVPNDSAKFDYYQANQDRVTAAGHVKSDPRVRPGAHGHAATSDVVLLPRPGSVLLFSGSNLHASIPNVTARTRYSIDFRTIDRRDVESGAGAPPVDVACTGTALRDFRSLEDGAQLPESLIRQIAGDPPEGALLVFDKETAQRSSTPA